jgi:tetratricopeptide (TPR) repeat protein
MRMHLRSCASPAVALCVFASLATGYASDSGMQKNRDSLAFGSVVIMRPPSLFGTEKAVLTLDGKNKKYKTGTISFAAEVKAGDYDVYTITASKPAAAISVIQGKTIYIVKNGDETAQQLFGAMRGRPPDQSELKKILKAHPPKEAAPDSSDWAELIIVSPPSAFGDEAALQVDAKAKKEDMARRTLSIQILPGSYAVYDSASPKPGATLTVASGELLYAVARADAGAQRQLGDIFFDNGNRTAALSLYRGALGVDSNTVDIYKRYADLALELEGGREATIALWRLDRVGQADGRDYQALGNLLAAANRNAEAQQMYDKALKMANNAPSVFAGLGAVKTKTGDLRGAAASYESAIKLRPDSARLYQLAGDVYLRLKDTAQAMASYGLFFEKGGRNAAAAFLVGRFQFLRGNFPEAQRYLLMVTGKIRQKPEYFAMLGETQFCLKEYAKAGAALSRYVKDNPRAPRWNAMAEMLLYSLVATRDYAKAGLWVEKFSKTAKVQTASVAYYRAFLRERTSVKASLALYEKNMVKYPGDYRSYLRCGALLSADKKTLARALDLVKKATALADTAPEAWKTLADVYRQLGRSDDELNALQVYCSAEPKNAEANARIGELMLRKGKTDEAIEKLQAAEKVTADKSVLKALSQGYAAAGNIDSAIAVLERAKTIAPNDVAVHQRLIDLYRKKGQTDKVIDEYKMLLELKRDTTTLVAYAGLLFENGKFTEAQNTIEDLRAIKPDHVRGLMLLGKILRAQQKYVPAIDVYKEISQIDPSNADALFERAETHLENGQPYWADLFFQRALKASPRNARAELGLAKVAKLRRNYGAYTLHVNRARKMSPDDPDIQQEFESGQNAPW